jgi:predicted nucleic acid-binding protein
MMTFWDTSAVLSLVFVEPRTQDAITARSLSDTQYAWRWMAVEAQAGLARRHARPSDWGNLERILDAILYVDLSPDHMDKLGRANREWRLRASDAGHLYCFQQISFVLPDIRLVSSDAELIAAAATMGLFLWTPPTGGASDRPQVRETPAEYARKNPRPARKKNA